MNPASFPDEEFELYSIPAHDRGGPEVAQGSAIGSAKQLVEPGDVMISKIIPHIRRARVVGPFAGRRQIASGEWIIFRGQGFHPNYLRHFLLGDGFHGQFMNTVAGVGGSLVRARPAQVRAIPLPLPSLPEQRRIAAILDHADALRAKRREALAHFDGLTQSIFLEMFGDPSKNPKQLPLRKLAELGRLDRGVSKHRPRNDPALMGGRFPLIQTGDVARSHGYIREYSSTYSDLGLAQSKVWPAGTLCVTIAANIGKTGILTFDACFPDSVVGFSSDPETVEYVRVWLSLRQAALEASAPQSAQKNINLAVLRALDVPLPDRTSLIGFSNRVSKVRELAETHRRAASKDDELLASLQSRAFDGRL